MELDFKITIQDLKQANLLIIELLINILLKLDEKKAVEILEKYGATIDRKAL